MTLTQTTSRLLVAASALALVACGGGNTPADTDASEQAGAMAEQAESAANDAADAAESAASDAAAATEDAVNDAADAAGDAMDAAGDAANDAMDSASDAMDSAADAAGDAADQASQAAGETMDAAEAAVEDAAESAGDLDPSNFRTASAEAVAAYEALSGDAAAGRRVFTKCMSCHVVQEGQNRVGPSLYGVIGRQSGSVDGFRYSNANKDANILWTEATMFEYLEAPQQYIPGTIMAFPGLPSPQDRADVIAYIKQESGQ